MGVGLLGEQDELSVDLGSKVQSYLGGNRKAGEALARELRVALMRRIRRHVACHSVAEELVQSTMLKIFMRLADFDSEKGVFESWIGGFAANALRAHYRSESRSRMVTVPVEALAEVSQPPTVFEDNRSLLSSALRSLDLLDQELLHMRFTLGLSSDEIAEECGMNAPQVRKRISRAVEKLRQHPSIQSIVR